MQTGIIYLFTYSLLTGFVSYFVKKTTGLNPQQILFFRAMLASVFLFTAALITGRMHELKPKHPINTLLMAFTQGISIYFYFAALEKTTIANAILLTYTAPIWSAAMSWLFLREKIERKTLLAIVLSLAGVVIIVDPSRLSLGPQYFLGSLFALLGGFFYAAMAISSKSLTQKATPLYAAFWQYFLIVFLSFFFAQPVSLAAASHNAVPLLYMGWAAGGLAFILYMEGVKRVKGQIIQIVTMLEIVIGILAGTLLLHEKLTAATFAGGVLILLGVLAVSARKHQK